MDVQGWVVIAVALLLFGYLVPHLVTTRQQLAEARVEDRFSTALRVVRTGTTTARETAPGEHHGTSRPYLHDPRRRTEGPAVKRPTTAGERAASEARRLAAARAARAAEISRRQAAARRRLVLTVVLLLATVGGWVGFGVASVSIALGIVPTVLLGAVLVAGRRAAKIAARRNAAARAAMARLDLRPAPRPTSTAPRASSAGRTAQTTAAPGTREARVDGDAATAEATVPATDESAPTVTATDQSAPTTGAESAGEWVPVPVPAPTYTLKGRAPRRDVAPYAAPEAPGVQGSPVVTPASPTVPAAASSPTVPATASSSTVPAAASSIVVAHADRPLAAASPAPADRAPAAASPAPAAPATAEESGLAGSPYAPVAASDAELQAEVAPLPAPAASGGIDLTTALARRRALGA